MCHIELLAFKHISTLLTTRVQYLFLDIYFHIMDIEGSWHDQFLTMILMLPLPRAVPDMSSVSTYHPVEEAEGPENTLINVKTVN